METIVTLELLRILEESRELRSKSELNTAHSLVISRDRLTIVRDAKFSDRSIRLRSHFAVAEYHPISNVDSCVGSMEASPHSSCSVIDRPVVKGKQPVKEETWQSSLQILSLVTEYHDILAKDSSDLGKSSLLEPVIDTGDSKPVKQPPRRVPPYQREVIDQQLDELLATGRVEPSQRPWISLWCLQGNMTGHIVCALTSINSTSLQRRMPYPCLGQMNCWRPWVGLTGFLAWICLTGYWQMRSNEEDKPKTAFATHHGQFQWTVTPFGLTNGLASFTRLMNLALSGLTWTHCLVYLDDIIIWAPTFKEHIRRLRLVSNRIKAAGLKLKLSVNSLEKKLPISVLRQGLLYFTLMQANTRELEQFYLSTA